MAWSTRARSYQSDNNRLMRAESYSTAGPFGDDWLETAYYYYNGRVAWPTLAWPCFFDFDRLLPS